MRHYTLGIYIALVGGVSPPDSDNNLWVNPFGMMPRFAVGLPIGSALSSNIQKCVLAIISFFTNIIEYVASFSSSSVAGAGGATGVGGAGAGVGASSAGCAAYGAGAAGYPASGRARRTIPFTP